jgi:hypothetical protein
VLFQCRGSDALFAATTGALPLATGRILRTNGENSGSLIVDASQPYFDVVNEGADVFYGTRVHKVGRSTGWTSGIIIGTCKDSRLAWDKIGQCNYEATYARNGGDSGGPVFIREASGDSTEVTLIGFHSAVSWEATPLFTKLPIAKQELGGSWSIIAHGPTGPSGPLSVSIAGPTDVSSLPNCTIRLWTDVSGGTGSYTYNWQTDGTIVQTSYGTLWATFHSSGGHIVYVTVSDGSGASASAQLELTSSPSGMECNN